MMVLDYIIEFFTYFFLSTLGAYTREVFLIFQDKLDKENKSLLKISIIKILIVGIGIAIILFGIRDWYLSELTERQIILVSYLSGFIGFIIFKFLSKNPLFILKIFGYKNIVDQTIDEKNE